MKHKTFRLNVRSRRELADLAALYNETETAVIRRLISEQCAQENKAMSDKFRKGDKVLVKPHTVWQNLSKGAVIAPPKKRERHGWGKLELTITAIYEDGAIEVMFPAGDVDLVPASALERV